MTPYRTIDGRYRVQKRLGSTPMGEVYKVEDLTDGSTLALKLSPEESSEEDIVRFKREFYTLARLRHPNIVEVKDFGILGKGETPEPRQTQSRCYFSMEYIEGEDALHFFDKKRPLTKRTCDFLYSALSQLCHALFYIHSKGLVHCDLKPGNILISKQTSKTREQEQVSGEFPTVKMLDFGLAGEMNSSSPSFAAGTLGYMAPEVLRSGKADSRSDLYSLGIVLWEILANRRAFPGDEPISIIRDNLTKELSPPTSYDSTIPEALEKMTLRLVSKEPRERYRSALEVIQELSSIAPHISVGKLPSERFYLPTSGLVGRDAVLSSFQSLLHKARRGAGQVVMLRGERGIGKSRLLQEFKFEAQLSGSTVVLGACCQSEKTPFSPWRHALSRLQRDDTQIPHFLQEASSRQGGPQAEKLHIFERMASRIVGLSKGVAKPLVILIDDLDLADSNSLDFFTYLSLSLERSSVLLAAFCEKNTDSADRLDELEEMEFAKKIELRELKLPDTNLMISNLLGSKDSHEAIAKWVHQQAGGNPLLIEETISSLVQDNVLKREGPKWSFEPEDLEKTTLSKDVESLVNVWLSRLGKKEVELLSLASVLGDGFDLRVLEELSRLEGPLFFQVLDSLEVQNLVRREQGTSFAFTHKWTQRILYDRISASRRENLHRKAGRAIERLSPDRWFDLAHHYLRGRIKGKAYKYSLLAGERARESFANREALEYYRNALRLSDELNRPADRVSILQDIGDACNLLGEYDEGLESYSSARALLASQAEGQPLADAILLRKKATIHHKRGDHGEALSYLRKAAELASREPGSEEMARILNEMGWVYQLKGEYDQAANSYHQALRIAKERDDLAMLSRTHYNLGVLFWSQKDLSRAAEYCEKALSVDRRTKDPYALASCYSLLGAIHFASGDLDKAIKSHRQNLKLSRETSEVYGQLTSLTSLGILTRRKGMLDEAEDYLSQALPLAEKVGDWKMKGRTYNNLGLVYQHKAKWDKAFAYYQRSLKALRKSGDEQLVAVCHDNLGSLHLTMGNLKDARRQIERGLGIREKSKDLPGLASSCFNMGQLMREESHFEEASGYLEKSVALYEKEGDQYNMADALASLANVTLSLGDREKALRYCRDCLELSERAGNPFAQGSTHRILARARYESGDRDRVEESLSETIEVFRKLGAEFELGKSLLEAGRLGIRMVEEGQTGDWLSSARSNLREAEKIFSRLGASKRAERARYWLDALTDRVLSGDFDISKRGEYLKILYQVSELVNSISSQDELLNQVLDLAIKLVCGERGLLLLIDEKTHDFFLAAGRGTDEATISDATKISKTIMDKVVESGRPVVSNDALHDPGFRESDSVLLNRIRSLLCVPLMAKGETIGTLYVDSRAQADLFSRMDEGFLIAVANLIGATIDQSKFSARLQSENISLKLKLHQRQGLGDLIGTSEEMQRIYEAAEKLAATECTVLLQGETGTGKELLARAIHHLGSRSKQKLLTIDCSALMETLLESELFGHKKGSFTGAIEDKVGLFEEAHKGTVFLDEIGDASLSVQANLLRVIERGEIRRVGETKWRTVDVRIICATNKDLEQEVSKRRFRQDLFYRLNTFTLKVPPLRDRAGDVYLLTDHFLKRYTTQFRRRVTGFTPDALNYLINHPWPGNVRELEKTIERAVIMCEGPKIALKDVCPQLTKPISRNLPLKETKDQAEAERVKQALVTTAGNVTRAAEVLGITRRQLYRLMAKHSIDRRSLTGVPSDQQPPGPSL